jgi:general secretion pathway protein J
MQRGFTLIELLVALSIMALMSVMGWRALDGMSQAARYTRTHTEDVLTVEAGLSQWGADLDALMPLPYTTALDWDGRALRMTRRHSAQPGEGPVVVAWTRSNRAGTDQWLRWQSAPVNTRAQWQDAWSSAAQWAQSPSDQARTQEVAITALAQWQVYYFRGGAWSNPLSSAGGALPDGVRLVLTLASPHPLAGTLTRDWARPVVGEGTP